MDLLQDKNGLLYYLDGEPVLADSKGKIIPPTGTQTKPRTDIVPGPGVTAQIQNPLPNAATTVGNLIPGLTSVEDLIKWFSLRNNWIRILKIIGGIVLVYAATQQTKTGQNITKAVT